VDLQGQLELVKAAKANGINRFIFVSFRHDPLNPSPLSGAKQAVERSLHDLNHTILQASFFMEVWQSPSLGFDYANARVRIFGSGEGKVSWISFFDVAELCVAVLDDKAVYRATIELGGPEALSPLQVVRIFEQESGRRYELEYVPQEALESQARASTGSLEKSFAALMLKLSRGDEIDMRPVHEKFPFPLTSVRDYARKVSG
jgi:NADH dehydrogenase